MNEYPTKNLGIKTWAEEDRPREKLLLKGKHNLSEAELIAILIGSGNREESAVGLAQRILNKYDNNLNDLGRKSIKELIKFKGIGEAKALSIAAAMELGRRRQLSTIRDRPQIKSSRDAYNLLAPIVYDLNYEEFWVLMLNRANRVIGRQRISSGGVSGTVVDAKIIFKHAFEVLASAIVLCHNHPSGVLNPSAADLDLTQKLKAGGKFLDIGVLDHLIIAEAGYYSFADEGIM